eukprot:760341-Hanusia_phi.AAC.4
MLRRKCSPAAYRWDPSSLEVGIGGSEQGVIHLAARLQALGWQASVSHRARKSSHVVAGGDLREAREEQKGEGWDTLAPLVAAAHLTRLGRPAGSRRRAGGPHRYVAWRDYASPLLMAKAARRRFIWLHDTVQEQAGYGHLMEHVDGVFVLSKFHASLLPHALQGKAIMTQNGVDEDMHADGPNFSENFIYASMPSRGLLHVLKVTAWFLLHQTMRQADRRGRRSGCA